MYTGWSKNEKIAQKYTIFIAKIHLAAKKRKVYY